ncbi:O-acyltransferase like protein-like [Elgaria multicarinata webbii]|uniref:O-acyltransferase like protein-like n=1 Tax=Elgaria multicarinata webbii TaxID=159646 RepID=UPI002FCCBD64
MAAFVLTLVLLLLLPGVSVAINITLRCWEDVTEFLSDLNAEKPKAYAIKMYDSIGKLSSNVLGGNMDRLGSYTECVSAEAPSGRFRGQYCKLQVQQDRMDYYSGICVPSSCQEEEITALAVLDVFKFKTTSFLSPLPSLFALNSTVSFTTVARCAKERFPIDAFVTVCLFISVFIITLPAAGTIYSADVWTAAKRTELPTQSLPSANYGSTSSTENDTSKSKAERKHGREPGSTLPAVSDGSKPNNVLEWEAKVLKNPIYIYSRSGPFYLGVDTFFLISGLLSTRSFLNMLNRSEKKIPFQITLKFLCNRLLRLQPLHMYSVCLLVGLYSITPWGALWELSKLEVDNCRRAWWANLMLVNNFIAGPEACNGWTWYLANDFQFYFTTPLLVFFSTRSKHWFIVLGTFLFLASFTVTALLSSFYRLPVANPQDMRKTSTVMYFMEYYSKPYCRYGPFLVGILLGLFMYHQQTPILRTKVQAAAGWLCAMFSMFMVVALAYTLEDISNPYSPITAIYQAVHRTIWAIAVGWIVFASEEGYGGFINWILSWGVWTVVAKISYACYLVHPMLILLYNGLQETLMHYSDINMFYLFLGHCLVTFIVGLALTVMIEMPLQELKQSLAGVNQQVVRL